VDLPQPDGPSRVTNSPLAISQLMSLNTGCRRSFLQVLDADEAHSLLSLFKMLATQVSTSTKKK
jgi:hypothetical protein